VPVDQLTTRDSQVLHAASGRALGYGELVADAAQLEPPQHPQLKSPADYRIVGTPRARFDVPAKVDGSAVYAADVRLPDMLHAALLAAPVFGGQLESVDPAPALARPGVRRVVELEQAVAVVADTTWQAQAGLAALAPRFSTAGHEAFTSESWFAAQQQALLTERGSKDRDLGDADAALAAGARRIAAEYRVPFLYHATMEPMCATVQIVDGRAEVWTGVQDPLQARRRVAKVSGIDPERVTVHNHPSGGGFGRRMPHEGDYVEQATRIAMAVAPAPVKLLWSREEDARHCFYRPAVSASFAGSVDAGGMPLAWRGRYTGRSEGAAAHPLYDIPNQDIRSVPMQSHVPEGPWRSVAFSQHGFFVESFADELAHAAGADPLEFRLAHLGARARHRAVLERVAQMSGWRESPRSSVDAVAGLRRGRGVAIVDSFGSIVAEVCEVAVANDGTLRVERVWAAVDCGIVVHPDTARWANRSRSRRVASCRETSTTIRCCACWTHRASRSSSWRRPPRQAGWANPARRRSRRRSQMRSSRRPACAFGRCRSPRTRRSVRYRPQCLSAGSGCVDARRCGRAAYLIARHQIEQLLALVGHRAAGRRGFLDQRGVALRDLVQMGDGRVDLVDAR
jgi:isoquinoline 1-oxidoreductase beta subunit